jgi:hypothetical protein
LTCHDWLRLLLLFETQPPCSLAHNTVSSHSRWFEYPSHYL